jgi:para-aminobenzoate synthetase / 4-amino-4-deoxychorismate lyase
VKPCRVHSESLGSGPAPDEMLRRLAGRPGVASLWGSWAGGGALLVSRPVQARSDAYAALAEQPSVEGADPAIVGGGWFGFVGYDPGCAHLAYYDHVLRWCDGEWRFEALWSPSRDGQLRAIRDELRGMLRRAPASQRPQWTVGSFHGPPAARHLAAVEQAIELIRAGELYQVNVCTRLHASFSGSPAAMFADAAARLRPVYGAFIDAGSRAVAGLSPELFLRRRGDLVTTSPIKGTALSAQALQRSAKDAAENVMIVDLMRNDLGRVARTGTVHVSELLSVEPHPGLWHLVSTVTARVDAGDTELLQATFPPGSVTGAPKLRALEAIAALEDQPRNVYTGAIGFVSPSWGAEFSVAIRTFEIADDTIELGVGGGITADSVPMLEWRECLHKAAPLLGAIGATGPVTPELAPTDEQLGGGLLETILALDGVPVRLADHLARLDRSCRELYGHGLPADLARRIRDTAPPGRAVIRVTAPQITISAGPAEPPPAASDVHVVRGRRGLWRHKWADRRVLNAAEQPGVPLFVADDGSVLETSRGNVFVLLTDGTIVTPPLRDDLLPGVTRRTLLDLARDWGRPTRLETFTVDDMTTEAAFWTSSLSGVVPIASVDGRPLRRRDAVLAELDDALSGGGNQKR